MEESLYGDLGFSTNAASFRAAENAQDLKIALARADKAETELAVLRTEHEALMAENAVLTKNISSLYLTAKLELGRKDRQIRELREQAKRMRERCRDTSRGGGGRGDGGAGGGGTPHKN